MIIHEHPHKVRLGNSESFKIIAFGDVHWGSRDCSEDRFERTVLKAHADDPNAYFINTGDSFDAIIPSDVKRFRASGNKNLRDEDGRSVKEAILDGEIEELASLWNKHKIPPERILGFVTGNHQDSVLRRHSTDMTMRLCKAVGAKYLGYSAFIKVNVMRDSAKLPLTVFVHHGFGGGTRTDGGSITKYCRHALRFQGAQFYFYGHDHQKWVKRLSTVEPDWIHGHARDKSIIVASCGSFKRTVSHDEYPSYSEVAGYPPAEMGCVVATVKHQRYQVKRRRYEGLECSASE